MKSPLEVVGEVGGHVSRVRPGVRLDILSKSTSGPCSATQHQYSTICQRRAVIAD
jgi:D-arabinose 1-dehydrogenase-like Zn-dependent alcohol dehydrogenase